MVEAAKKASLFGGIRSLFVEEVPEHTGQTAPITITTARPEPPVTFGAPPAQNTVTPDPAVIAKLEAKLQSKMPSIYQAFMDQYETLRDVIPDETTRFKAALKTSKTTPELLAGAVDNLIQVMQDAQQEFTKSFEDNKGKVLSQAQQSIAATEGLIETREKQIKAIEEEIASLRTKLQTDRDQAKSEEQRFEGIRASFAAAHAQVVSKLTAQRHHIASQH